MEITQKVKVITSHNDSGKKVEKEINAMLKQGDNILDIKYQISDFGQHGATVYSALVLYETTIDSDDEDYDDDDE